LVEPPPIPPAAPPSKPALLLPNKAHAPSAVPMIPSVRPAFALPFMSLLLGP